MKFFRNSKNEKLIKLLHDSKQDFGFDQRNLKSRLMMAVNSRHLSIATEINQARKNSLLFRYSLVGATAVILLIGASGLSFAAGHATPGTKLYQVQKLQNQAILSLPLPESEKEEIRTNIAVQRVQEIERLPIETEIDEKKLEASLQESNDSLDAALAKLPVKTKGQEKKDEKTQALIQKLDVLSNSHQKKLEILKTKVKDGKLKDQIDKNLIQIKARRQQIQILENNQKQAEDKTDSSD